MGRTPLLLPLAGVICGILLAELLPGFPSWGAVIIGIIGLSGTFWRPGILSLFLMFLAAGWGVDMLHKPTALTVSGTRYYSAEVLQASHTSGNAMMGIVAVDSVDFKPVDRFNVNVQIIGHRNVIKEGERVVFHSDLKPVAQAVNLPDIAVANINHRRFGVVGFSMVLPDSLRFVGDATGFMPEMVRLNRKLLVRLSHAGLDDNTYSILSAMLLGDRSGIGPDEVNAFSASGLSHLLALSGTHVAVIVSLISLALFPLTIARRNTPRYLLSILLLWGYASLTGMNPSVVRASVMASAYLLGRVLERRSVPLNSLCLAALIILLFKPVELFMPGFQMSFAAVAGIIIFYPLINRIDRRRHPFLYMLWSYPAISVSAMILTGLVAAWYFHTFPLYFLLANLLVVPLMPLILGLGVILLINPGSDFVAIAENKLCGILSFVSDRISNLPDAVIADIYLPLWLTVLLIILFIILGVSMNYNKKAYEMACCMLIVGVVVFHKLNPPVFPSRESFELDGAEIVREGNRLIVYVDYFNEEDKKDKTMRFAKRLRHYSVRRNLPPPEIMKKE